MDLESNFAQRGVPPNTPIAIIRRNDMTIPRQKSYDLPALLSQITESNLHQEIDTGPPVGQEIW